MNNLGSQEFDDIELEAMNNAHELHVEELERIAKTSQDAKEFLNTELGKAIRKTIAINMRIAQERCTIAKDEALVAAQFEYKVWAQVATVFGTVIQGGEEALQELEQMRME